MRDGITLARAGVPAVVFVFDNFEKVARAQARALGVPGLRILVYPQYVPGVASAAAEEEKALRAAAAFPAMLVQG